MKAFTSLTSKGVPLYRHNIDTDQIIPARWLQRTERVGYEEGLFENLRKDPDFVLNNPAYEGAQILVAGSNFGCGSSREHAPWALRDYGFRVIVAESFADIHRINLGNCGILAAQVEPAGVQRIVLECEQRPGTEAAVDLRSCTIGLPGVGLSWGFDVDPGARRRLLAGMAIVDDSGQWSEQIAAHEARRPAWMPRTR